MNSEELNLFLPSQELANRLGKTYPWEGRVDELVREELQDHGRADFDYPHTKSVVNWTKIIGELEDLPAKDREILAVSAYGHDVKYDFKGAKDASSQLDAIRKQKKSHMKAAAELARKWYEEEEILKESFTENEWEEVVELIGQHDEWDRIEQGKHHRLLPYFVAADTLGQIDLRAGVIPSFSQKDLRRYVSQTLTQRMRVMKGSKTRQAFNILLNEYLKHLNESG